ncbi:hypothetical protein HZ326_13201 [Fusarium oxysporum f. sp. albedinis]|nr:hypothetical protein HZ326_13201 [Fusarium oxysporum f. sp. albedinis]
MANLGIESRGILCENNKAIPPKCQELQSLGLSPTPQPGTTWPIECLFRMMGNCGIGSSLDLGPAAIWAMLDIGRGQGRTGQGYRNLAWVPTVALRFGQ